MDTVKDVLDRAHAELGSFETALRGTLKNQNIADIVASARAKLAQAASHQDAATELSQLRADPAGDRHPFGANQHGIGPNTTDGKPNPLFNPQDNIG